MMRALNDIIAAHPFTTAIIAGCGAVVAVFVIFALLASGDERR